MNTEHVFWFCFVASFSSVSIAAKSLPHQKNETNFNLQSEMKLSSNSTTSQPLLLFSDTRSEAQDVVNYLPKQNIKRGVDFNVEKSKERDDVSSHSLTRNSDVLGEVSLSLNNNNEHGAKGNSSDNVKSTNNYETPLQDNSFGSSTKDHVSSGHSEDNVVSNDYYEAEYVTENKLQKGITKTEANEKLRNLKSERIRVTLSEPSAREGNLVTYPTDSGAQSMLLDEETRDHDNITESNTDTTVNNDVKAPNDTGKAIQSGPDHVAQNNASEYTDIIDDTIKNGYTGKSTTGIVTDIIKELNSLESREGEESAGRYSTLKHTLGRDREPSHSPNQVENDYADDYYEVWRRNNDRTTTSATENMEIKATNDKNQRDYVPYFPKLTFGTEKVTYSTSGEVTNATLDYDSTLSEEGVRATTDTRKQPVSTKNVPYFPTGQDAEHTFGTENVKNVYIYDEVKTAPFDHGNTIREEGVRATSVTRKPPESVQDSANSEDVPKTVKMDLYRDLENVNVANNNAMPRQLEEKYSSIETTNNGSSSVSEPTVSPDGTSRGKSCTKTNKLNCSANESGCSTTPQELMALKSVHNLENGSEIDPRAQRGSWRKDFQVSEDFAASEDCHAGVTQTEDDREETSVHELPTKQKLASDNSDIPENYDTCVENDTDTTVLKNGTKITPETQKPEGEVWNKQGAKNQPREGDNIDAEIMTNEGSHSKMPGSVWKILPTGNNRAGVRETSLSEYPWFVIIETSSEGTRCGGVMVAPRWLMTASSCVREDDTRTDAYSAPVQVRVNVTGRSYQAVRAVFAPGGGVALVRLAEPPASALFSAGRLDLADVDPPTLWTCCVALGMGRCEEDGRAAKHCEQVLAVGTWAVAVEDSPQQRQRTAPSLVRAPCGGDPGAPLACHRRYMGRAGLTPPPPPLPPPENEPEGLFLVAVAAGHSKPGLGCRGSYADYWNVATLQNWLEDAIVSTNTELDKTSRSRNSAMLPPDPYSQRLHRMRMEGSLPEPRFSRGPTSSGGYLLPLLTAAAASYTILLAS